MATVVFVHAHPDDECFTTGGTMARLVAEGHRVVLVTCTGGELGEVPDGLLAPGEALGERRRRELEASARALGVTAAVRLGYRDSGMAGTDGNGHPDAFCNADLEEAARRVAALLEEHGADVLVGYDPHGGYGHPDHVMVHRVAVRAAELHGTPSLFEATIDRDRFLRLMREQQLRPEGEAPDGEGAPSEEELARFGLPSEAITTRVDVAAFLDRKRASMASHETQVGDMGFFLALDDERFRVAVGEEAFRCVRSPGPPPVDHLV